MGRRMSEQLHCWVGSAPSSSGPRSIAKALLISFCVHASIFFVLWQVISSQSQTISPRALRMDLSTAARPASAIAPVSVPAEPKPEASKSPIRGSSDRPARTPLPVKQPATHLPAIALSDTGASSSTGEADFPPQAEAQKSQEGEMPIDLRVLDWLARYRSYPLAARRARIEGVVELRVTLMPDGRLVDARVERSSGHPLLDQAALDLLARAAPLPSDFGTARTEQIELQLPIVFRMRTSST
jgi:periplasmic protein TonB